MKKLIFTAFILSVVTSSFAQGFYFRLGLGYAFPQAGQTLDGTGAPYSGSRTNSTYLQTYSVNSASFSAGFQGGLGLGYMFNEHVGVQLDASVGLANKKYTFDDENVNLGSVQGSVTYIQQAKSPVIFIPALVLQTGGDPWNIYARVGLAVPISTKITEDQVVAIPLSTGGLEIDDYTSQIKNSFSLGYSAAAGVHYKLNDKVSIWGEVSLLSLSVYIKESDLTSVTSNGQSVPLSQVNGTQTVKYSKKATVDSNGAQEPTYSQPFSNVGINFGIAFRLGDNSRSKSHGKRRDDDIDGTKPFRRR